MLETSNLPSTISMFPGLTDRVYYQDPDTKEFWFHATSVCKTLGYTNVTSALGLHCDEDEKFQEIWQGKATWFVSEAGCYGLAMGAKNETAKNFKRWLKHDVLPKLRASGGYIMPTATSQQIEALKSELTNLTIQKNYIQHLGGLDSKSLKDWVDFLRSQGCNLTNSERRRVYAKDMHGKWGVESVSTFIETLHRQLTDKDHQDHLIRATRILQNLL